MFTGNGFHIVYDKDGDEPIADGFYFTIGYKNLDSNRLLELLLQYGMCAITLDTTGSEQKGVMRVCVSLIPDEQLPDLEQRAKLLNEHMQS